MPEPPERSTILVDVNKQIVTLASAVLALAATFATGVIGKNLDGFQALALGLSGLALFAALLCALISHARVISYVQAAGAAEPEVDKVKRCWNSSAGWANAGFACFAAAFLFLLVFVGLRVADRSVDAETVIAGVAQKLTDEGKIAGREGFVSLTVVEPGEDYELVFTGKDKARLVCRASRRTGALAECR